MRLPLSVLLLVSLSVGLAVAQPAPDRDTAFQVSTLDALVAGLLDGLMPVGEMLRHGDTGIGTFHGVDGEMVVLDGKVYRVAATGRVNRVSPRALTPFVTLSFLDPDLVFRLDGDLDMKALEAKVDSQLPSLNYFYLLRLDGTFSYMKTRSVPRQQKPYPPLTQVAATQPVFEMKDVAGTLVGWRCPYFAQGANFVGYHLHFLSADRTQGGHVLGFRLRAGQVTADLTPRLRLQLPETRDYQQLPLQGAQTDAVYKVEKGGR